MTSSPVAGDGRPARRLSQAAGIGFLGIGAFLAYQGQALGIQGPLGPGAGFFAHWVGLALAVASLAWLVQVSRRPADSFPAAIVPERDGILRVISVMFALIVFALTLNVLGFNLTMLGLLLFLLLVFGREHALAKLVIAVAGSFGVHHVFEAILKVPLPYSSIEALRTMGL